MRLGSKVAAGFLLALAPLGAPWAQVGSGAIRGTVIDAEVGIPLRGVGVSMAETALRTTTTDEGQFLLESVAPGSYTLTFSKEGYERIVRTNVVVTAGQIGELTIEMGPEVLEMEELVVTGGDLLGHTEIGLLEVRQDADVIQDALSSDFMSQAGVSDVAAALKLVVGTTVFEGKYATVRGLSDRYTGTTLNGVRVPSADPRRRAVQVDQFPTGTIESVTVTKTFTPDLRGDFTGGGIDIKTKSIPDAPLLKFSIGTEYNSIATGNDRFLSYAGGGVERWAKAGSSRNFPSLAGRQLPTFPQPTAFPPAQNLADAMVYDSYVRAFDPTMGLSTRRPGLDSSYSLLTGNRFAVGRRTVLGAVGAFTYSRKYDFYEGAANDSAVASDPDQPINVRNERVDNRGAEEVLIGGLADLVAQFGDEHELSLKMILNQTAEDTARFQVEDKGGGNVEQNQALQYTERTVSSIQLHGKHTLGAHSLDWVGSRNSTEQDEPDVRFFRNVFDFNTNSGGKPANSTDPQNTRRIFRNATESNYQLELDSAFAFDRRSGREAEVRYGVYLDGTDRDFTQDSFTYRFANQYGSPFNPAVAVNLANGYFAQEYPGQLWTDVFLDPHRIGLAGNRCPHGVPPATCAAENQLLWYITPVGNDVDYTGDQKIEAAYGMIELPLADRLGLVAGARYETTDLSIAPTTEHKCQSLSAPFCVEVIEILPSGVRALVESTPEDASASIDESSVLPSIGLSYDIRPTMKLRSTWSRTIARPTFRELAPVATEEFIFGDAFIGNPDLVLSTIANFDVRWEWFPAHGDVLAVSTFYKEITDPIELLSFSVANRSFIQPVNFDRGTVRGVEIEGRRSPRWAPGFGIGLNATLIDSEVEVPESEQISLASFGLEDETRRLQGQPEYVVNVNLTYDNERSGTSMGLFYTEVGRTLKTGAARGIEDGSPNVFEESYANLDFTLTQNIKKGFSLSLEVKNLTRDDRDSVYRRSDGEEVIKATLDTARKIGLSARYSW